MRTSFAQADVGDEAQARAAFSSITGTLGDVDVLCNNAGIGNFEHAGFLPVSDFDGLEETGFGALSACLRAPERDLTIDAVQIGEPEIVAGSLNEREGRAG